MALEANEPAKRNNINNILLSEQLHDNSNGVSKKLHDDTFEVPDHLKQWFSHKGRQLYTEGREKYLSDDVVTWDELKAGDDVYTDSFHHQMFEELRDNIYQQKFKSQIAAKVLDESNGTSYDVPAHLKSWFEKERFYIDSQKGGQLDGVITVNELANSSNSFQREENLQNVDQLRRYTYSQRFKPHGNLPIVSQHLNITYKLDKDIQNWVNQNGYQLDGCRDDGTTGAQDGEITTVEMLAFAHSNSPNSKDEAYQALSESVLGQANKVLANNKPFLEQVSKDPKSLKTWFEQHKEQLDTDNNGKVSDAELYFYGSKTKLKPYDRTMFSGLIYHGGLFTNSLIRNKFNLSSEDIDVGLKLACRQISPAQVAMENTINPTKLGATLGALGGGALGLGYAGPLASSAYASWGTLSAGSIGTCAAITASGAIVGALLGTVAIGGTAYGVNYFAAQQKAQALRDALLIK